MPHHPSQTLYLGTTQDAQRIVEAAPGRLYVIEGCVSTTATYGDAFRALTLYRAEASDSGGTLLTVSAQIVFVRRINSFIRALIHRAADGGMRSNFAAVLATLAEQAEVTDGSEARPANFSADKLMVASTAGEVTGRQPAQPAVQSTPQPSLSTASEGRMAALLSRLAASRMLIAAAAAVDAVADRCRLDAEALRGVAALLAWAVCFKVLALLCRSDGITAIAVVLMSSAIQRQRKQIQVSSRQALWNLCGIAAAHALAAL